ARAGPSPPRQGVAAQNPPRRLHRAAHEAVLTQGVRSVLRARRVVLAGRRAGDAGPVEERPVDEAQPTHAAAFPNTSSTRSTSHSWPRDSAASGRPGRTTST